MTAVEWLEERLSRNGLGLTIEEIKQAKEMEKEQIIDTFQDSRILSITNNCSSGEQYYNETFKPE
jgi:uncharacterized protein involved in exopolysaccharide biosynthesis